MENYDFGGSYYSRSVGFVIDGTHFGHNHEKALNYLMNNDFMESSEAESFLSRLMRAFTTRVRKAEAAAMASSN